MKKLLSLIGALLLWQSVAVAQNYLHITSGDSTKIVRMAELDSVTVRDAEFYDPKYLCEGTYSDSFFTGVPQTVSVYVQGNQYIAKGALVGNDLTIDCNPTTGACVVKEQFSGYNHPTYGIIRVYGNGIYEASAQLFTLELNYIVDAGTFGSYIETLQLGNSTRATANNHKEATRATQFKQLGAIKLASPRRTTLQEGKVSNMQLQPMTTREITEKE